METTRKELWLRQTAVILTFIMGFLWLIFGILETYENENPQLVIGSILPGAVIILFGLLAIRWTVLGGACLIVFAMVPFIMVLFGVDIPFAVLLLLSFPLLISGALFIVDHIRYQSHLTGKSEA